jgi:hypothetical protein
MIKTKPKKCKGTSKAIGYGCGKSNIPHKFGLCSVCFRQWLFDTNSGLAFLESTKIRAKKQVQIEVKKGFNQKKEDAKSKSYFEKLLQTEINSIVRLIDTDKGCISCDHGWDGQWRRQRHAGHRISIGSNPTLRYNMFNIWVQCSICNNYLSGNERMFDKGILHHYGIETLELIKELPSKTGCLSLSKEELKETIEIARQIKKDIISGTDYSRDEINIALKIYI